MLNVSCDRWLPSLGALEKPLTQAYMRYYFKLHLSFNETEFDWVPMLHSRRAVPRRVQGEWRWTPYGFISWLWFCFNWEVGRKHVA